MLWDLAMLFIGLAAVYFIGVFFYRNKISFNSQKVRDRKRELSPMISEFLFLEDDATKDEKSNYIALKIEIRQLLKDAFNRKILSEILLDLRKDVSGEAQRTLFELYQDLGLHKDAFTKLRGWRWHIISKGIIELTQMEVAESYGFITKFINDKRPTIRKQAEIATVTLRHEGINYFLDSTKYRISEWQQLKLLDVIRNKEDFQPPRFNAWLTSNNKYVVLFALRLIKYYNQNDADPSLIELVKHKNNQIKEEAIACIKEFNVTESLGTLKMVFWKCTIDVKIAILDAIAQIGSDADIEFLNLIDKKELNYSVKSKALSSINTISPESIMPSKGIQDESRYEIPNDITEAVAKKNDEKHAEISGENDREFIDEELSQEKIVVEETESNPIEEDSNKADKVEVEATVERIDGESNQHVISSEDADTFGAKELTKDLDEIEQEVEKELIMEGEINESEFDDKEWSADFLDFLPIIVTAEESEFELEPEPRETNKDESSKLKEDLLNIQVVHEELMPNEVSSSSEEDTQNEEIPSFFDELNMRDLAFLPIVVDSEPEPQDAQIEEFENEKVDLIDMPVQYDEVQPNLQEEQQKETLTTALELDFEPFHELKDIDTGAHSIHPTHLDYKCYSTDEIRNASVIYEEVLDEDEGNELFDIEVIDPYFFAAEYKTEQTSEVTFKDREDSDEIELPIENEQLLQKIIDDLIALDDMRSEANTIANDSYINPDWDLDEDNLDFIPVSFEKDEEDTPNYIKIETKQNSGNDAELNIPKASIPKAIFGDIEFEASTRQLLNELEEMGDQREIPFLKELLSHEKYDLFKARINNLIDTFNRDEEKENIENPLQPFSVFQDLFRTCDTEAKLILLNEVVAVGDEKEIHFLEGLSNDDSSEIRKKAFEVLKELKTKLFGKEEEDLKITDSPEDKVSHANDHFEQMEVPSIAPSNDPTDIFDLNFDFTEEFDEKDDEKKKDDEKENDKEQDTVQYGSFFGQICSFSHKIMKKLNG